jgi:AAA15 family ATPase/GTPase
LRAARCKLYNYLFSFYVTIYQQLFESSTYRIVLTYNVPSDYQAIIKAEKAKREDEERKEADKLEKERLEIAQAFEREQTAIKVG